MIKHFKQSRSNAFVHVLVIIINNIIINIKTQNPVHQTLTHPL